MTKTLADLSVAELKQAVQLKEQIERLQSELSAVFSANGPSQKPSTGSGMSEATKAKLRAAAKARWAKVNAGKPTATAAKSATSGTRKPMSAAARARLSALMKAKWEAKNKVGNKASANTASKKPAAKKQTMSPAAKAKLSALAKARWAKVKASGKKSL